MYTNVIPYVNQLSIVAVFMTRKDRKQIKNKKSIERNIVFIRCDEIIVSKLS
ncbi:MAG: hypothetical protein ACLRHW_16075 [Coprobacillus cateniformis]